MGRLPQVLMDAGVSRSEAGLLLGLISLLGLPVSLTIPAIAARRGSQSGWVVIHGAFAISGILGLLFAPAFSPLLWSVLLGLGMGVFSLALTVIALRRRTVPTPRHCPVWPRASATWSLRWGRSSSACCTTSPVAGPPRSDCCWPSCC